MAQAKLHYLLKSSWIGLWYLQSKCDERHNGYLKISLVEVWRKTPQDMWQEITRILLVHVAPWCHISHIMGRYFWRGLGETKNFLISGFKADFFAWISDPLRILLWFLFKEQVPQLVCPVGETLTSSVVPVTVHVLRHAREKSNTDGVGAHMPYQAEEILEGAEFSGTNQSLCCT